jgi:hypothetical protein
VSFFPLTFRCTVERETRERDQSRQVISTFNPHIPKLKCAFYKVSGSKVSGPAEDFRGNFDLYVDLSGDIKEGDRVTNIRTKKGQIVYAGPFEITKISTTPNPFTGKLHHRSIKLEGLGQVK